MQKVTRRQFIGSMAAGAALALPVRRVLGANNAINVGFIGTGSRGGQSIKWFGELSDVRIAALCDPDRKRLEAAQKKNPKAKAVTDLRKVIGDKDIDAVVISTCNHWHALAAVWACQAGKDVYVEKPVSHNIWEGRKIVEAARKYKRIVQGGTQQRSDPVQAKIRQFIHEGKLGKMLWIRGNRYGMRDSIGKLAQPLKPPAEVDYDLWLGPAQDVPMYRKEFHYDWHWMWNTGNGEMGNWGVHVLDDIRNMLEDRCSLPVRCLSGGGRVVWDDAGESPNVHFVYFDTGVVPVIFDLSNLSAEAGKKSDRHFRGVRSGYVIQFEEGYYAGGRGGGWTYDNKGSKLEQFKGNSGGAHAKNFIDAIRARDPKIQVGEIEQVHYSSAWCHLANIAYRLGGAYQQGKALEMAKDFAPWKELLDGFHAHLEAQKVDPVKAGLKVSSILEIDPQKETFVGPSATPEALKLLRREYRTPFTMPEQV